MDNKSFRILAKGVHMSNNTWETGLNNNDLIIGPSGAGKTRGYVIPNILNSNESMIIADTKGNLRYQLGARLKEKGYTLVDLDFKDVGCGHHGYNPMRYIRGGGTPTDCNEEDIATIAQALCPVTCNYDSFWQQSAQAYLECLIAYVLCFLPENERHLGSVSKMAELLGSTELDNMMAEIEDIHPDSFAARRYRIIRSNRGADRMDASIRGFVFTALKPFNTKNMVRMFTNRNQFDIASISQHKTAVFLNISDTERSRDPIVNLLYAQTLQVLCRMADRNTSSYRLDMPVRLILDDFATNTIIPHFDQLISVIRSREISVSLIIQSLSQLQHLYGAHASTTIVNNCDNLLYLGGQDVETAKYIALKLNKTVFSVLNLPLDSAFLFTRGKAPLQVQKYSCQNAPVMAASQYFEKEGHSL